MYKKFEAPKYKEEDKNGLLIAITYGLATLAFIIALVIKIELEEIRQDLNEVIEYRSKD